MSSNCKNTISNLILNNLDSDIDYNVSKYENIEESICIDTDDDMPELEDANNELNNCNILENKCTLGFYDEKYIDDINISPIKYSYPNTDINLIDKYHDNIYNSEINNCTDTKINFSMKTINQIYNKKKYKFDWVFDKSYENNCSTCSYNHKDKKIKTKKNFTKNKLKLSPIKKKKTKEELIKEFKKKFIITI